MSLVRVALAVIAALSCRAAYAFHSGGVAECEGCTRCTLATKAGRCSGRLSSRACLPQYSSGPYLLKAQDQSGACLNCHGAGTTLSGTTMNELSTLGDEAGVASYDSSTTDARINCGYSAAMQQQAYNGRPAAMFGPYARKPCNKCHAKD